MAANQNVTQLTQQVGTAAPTSLFYAVTNGTTDTGLPLSVFVNSLGLTGTPTAPTATTGTNTTQIASCAFVQAQLTSTLASYAPLASPTFTGTVTIPTVTISAGTINSTSVGATTPSTGSFTTLASSGLASLSSLSTSSATLTGGTINAMAIGASTASTGRFTTVVATSTITPSTTAGIVGTTAADNAQAGSVGEYITATGTNVALTTATPTNITSISLTAGDWDVGASFGITPAGTTVVGNFFSGINTTSATLPAFPGFAGLQFASTSTLSTGGQQAVPPPSIRVNVTTTTTVFLVGQAAFSTSTCTASGVLWARRRR